MQQVIGNIIIWLVILAIYFSVGFEIAMLLSLFNISLKLQDAVKKK